MPLPTTAAHRAAGAAAASGAGVDGRDPDLRRVNTMEGARGGRV